MFSFILGMFVVFSPETTPTKGWEIMTNSEVVRRNISWSIEKPKMFSVYYQDNFKKIQKCGDEKIASFRK